MIPDTKKWYKITDTKNKVWIIRASHYRKALEIAKAKGIQYMVNLNEPELFQKES